MAGMMLTGIFLKAFVLMALLYFLARDEADYDFPKVAMVSAGILLIDSLSGAFLQPHLGLLVFVPVMGGSLWLIKTFCWLTWKKASLVTLIFFTISIGFNVGAALVLKSMMASGGKSQKSQQEIHEDQLKEAAAFMKQAWSHPKMSPSTTAAPPSTLPAAVRNAASRPASVGGTAVVAAATLAGGDWPRAYAQLKIGGSMNARNATLVMINNSLYGDNERVSVTYKGKKYTWRVKITDAQTTLEPLSVAGVSPATK